MWMEVGGRMSVKSIERHTIIWGRVVSGLVDVCRDN